MGRRVAPNFALPIHIGPSSGPGMYFPCLGHKKCLSCSYFCLGLERMRRRTLYLWLQALALNSFTRAPIQAQVHEACNTLAPTSKVDVLQSVLSKAIRTGGLNYQSLFPTFQPGPSLPAQPPTYMGTPERGSYGRRPTMILSSKTNPTCYLRSLPLVFATRCPPADLASWQRIR